VVREISQLGRALRADPEYLKNPAVKVKTLFLRDAIEIIQRGGVSEERLAGILHRRSETLLSRHNDDFMMISVIEKIPMALGTLGSILSLVHQFHDAAAFEAQIQTNSAFQALFFSLSRASVPLIYGIIFSQFFLVPLRNKIAKLNQADHMIRQIVTDGAVLLLKKEHPVLIDDHLKSYLTPGEQAQLKA
jgi:flagellar motor component MotA